jgi:hypothetical protein
MSVTDVMESYIADARRGDFDAAFGRFALLVVERFHRDGEVIEIRRANVYRVRGEEIVEIWIFEADQYAADALLE